MEEKYKKFLKTVCESEVVWALKNEDGYATSDSNEFVNEDEEAYGLFCFWSDLSLAKACAVKSWSDYVPDAIRLSDFIEHWCVGMSDDEMLAGIDFDSNMCGSEIEPLELILALSSELKKQHKTLTFEKFKTLKELTDIVDDLVS